MLCLLERCQVCLKQRRPRRELVGQPICRESLVHPWMDLQELIAPVEVHFFDQEWRYISSRSEIVDKLAEISGITEDVLRNMSLPGERSNFTGRPSTRMQLLNQCSIAQRISWAARRNTTRSEDRAYSLLGLLGVNMPLLYGEGVNAFQRLQAEILRASSDLSILVWPWKTERRRNGSKPHQLLASTPDDFRNCGYVVRTGNSSDSITEGEITLANVALRVTAPLIAALNFSGDDLLNGKLSMFLKCRLEKDVTGVFGLILRPGAIYRWPEDAMKAEIVECHSAGHVVYMDAFHALNTSEMKSIAILLNPSDGPRSSFRGADAPCSYLWLRFSNRSLEEDWQTIDTCPRNHWNKAKRTFDFSDFRAYNATDKPIFGAISLKASGLQPITIAFRYQWGWSVTERSRNLSCNVAHRHFLSPSKLLENPVRSLKISHQKTIEIRPEVTFMFGESVAILHLDITSRVETQSPGTGRSPETTNLQPRVPIMPRPAKRSSEF